MYVAVAVDVAVCVSGVVASACVRTRTRGEPGFIAADETGYCVSSPETVSVQRPVTSPRSAMSSSYVTSVVVALAVLAETTAGDIASPSARSASCDRMLPTASVALWAAPSEASYLMTVPASIG